MVALLGLVGPAFFLAFSSSTRAIQITGDQIQAEALARTQLEAIMNSPYASSYSLITTIPDQFSLSINVETIDSATCVADGNCDTLQEIKVSISRPAAETGDRPVLYVSTYKADT